jgi:hypothetical protein
MCCLDVGKCVNKRIEVGTGDRGVQASITTTDRPRYMILFVLGLGSTEDSGSWWVGAVRITAGLMQILGRLWWVKGKRVKEAVGGELRVGEVVVPVGVVKGREGECETKKAVTLKQNVVGDKVDGEHGGSETGEQNRKLVRRYRSNAFDLKWARPGVIATVKNEEVISIIHATITDAGF